MPIQHCDVRIFISSHPFGRGGIVGFSLGLLSEAIPPEQLNGALNGELIRDDEIARCRVASRQQRIFLLTCLSFGGMDIQPFGRHLCDLAGSVPHLVKSILQYV